VTADAGADRVHEHNSPPGAFSLGGEYGRELCPARVKYRGVEPGFRDGHVRQEGPRVGRVRLRCWPTGHADGVELFQGDHVAGVHQSPGGLVVEVAAPVAHLAPFLGQGAAEPLAIPRAALRPFLAPLQVSDHLGRGGEELRIGDDLTV
jgi:hypothetical protein